MIKKTVFVVLFYLTNNVCVGQLTDRQIEDFLDTCSVVAKPQTSEGIRAIEEKINEKYQYIVEPKEPVKKEPKKSNARTNALRIRENKENEAKARKDYEEAMIKYREKLDLKEKTEREIASLREQLTTRKEILTSGKDVIAGPVVSLTTAKEGFVGFLALNKANPPALLNLEFNRKWRGMSDVGEFYIYRTLNRVVIHGLDSTLMVNKSVYQLSFPVISMKPTDDQNLLQFRIATRKEVVQLVDAVRERFDSEIPSLKQTLALFEQEKVGD